MPSKKKNRKMKKARKTAKPLVPVIDEHNDNRLWRLVTDHPDIFDTLIVTKLNDNDVKFFYDVNSESRAAIKRAGAQLRNAFKIEDFDTKSTLSWALQKCARSKKKKLFCSRMARNGKLELLKFLRVQGCPWDRSTCSEAAKNGHLECLKYLHENGCPWDGFTCYNAAGNGHLECLQYAHENGCPWNEKMLDSEIKEPCCNAAYFGHLECLKYAHENGCPWDKLTCSGAALNRHLECLKYAHENCLLYTSPSPRDS